MIRRLPAGRSSPLIATLGVVVAALCWALAAVIAKGAFERGITPAQMAEARIGVAAVPLLAYLALRHRHLLGAPRPALPYLAGFGVALAAVNFSYYLAIDRLPVGVAIALQYTAPVMILALGVVVLRRPAAPMVWLAGLLTLVGAFLVSGASSGFARVDPIGLLAGAASAVWFAAYLLTAEAAGRRGAHPASALIIGFAVAALVWGIAAPWWSWPVARLAEPEIALRVLGVGLVGTLLPFLLTVAALPVISAGLAAIAATSEPVFASALAWLMLNQQLTPLQLLGGGCVVGGVLIGQLRRAAPRDSIPLEVSP